MAESSKRRMPIWSRAGLKRLAIAGVIAGIALTWAYLCMIRMPGVSHEGDLPALTEAQTELADQLRRDVTALAADIGFRDLAHPAGLRRAVAFIEQSLQEAGLTPSRHGFEVLGTEVFNIEAEIRGSTSPAETLIIGAHYDSVEDCPAANDNGSGVAGTLAIAHRLMREGFQPARTVRFVLFVNEEPPHFQSETMGSLAYARRCKERGENVVGMISLETIGFYSDEPGSQLYPIAPIGWLYPDRGNFIAFVGDYGSRELVREAIGSFRRHARFPSEGAALPGWVAGVGWSDHWAFWQAGFPALMVTDTAPFRYAHYHKPTDTPDKLDYERTARVVEGMGEVVKDLAGRTGM